MRSKQRGVFLIGATIAVAVVGILVAFWGQHQMQQMRIEKGERVGESLKVLGNHVQDFMVKHHGDIKALFLQREGASRKIAESGIELTRRYDVWLRAKTISDLTVEKLIRLTGAKGTGSSPPLAGAEYRIVVYSTNCADKTEPCDIDAVTYLTAPIKSTYSNGADWVASGAALAKLGVLGGISRQGDPNVFRFLDGNGPVINTVRNPERPAIAGLLAMRGGYQTSAQDAFLRRDGTREMQGDLNLSGNNIVNAKQITNVELVDVEKMTAKTITATENIHSDGQISAKGIFSSDGATITGKLEVKNQGVHADGEIRAQGELRSEAGVVRLKGAVGGSCSDRGIGLDEQGRVMSCQSGTWTLGALPKDSTEVSEDIRSEIVKGYVPWDVASITVNNYRDFKARCESTTTTEIPNGFACQLDVVKNYCEQIPRLRQRTFIGNGRRDVSFEIPPSDGQNGSIAGGIYKITCLTPRGAPVQLVYRAANSTGAQAFDSVRPATEEDLRRLIVRSRLPQVKSIKLFEEFRCALGDAGHIYNLDEDKDGPWDYCEMASDEAKYQCDWPNQMRDLYRDIDSGAWKFRLKQRGGGVKCVKFAEQ
ncbi:hypothetical protein PPN31114_01956 [Pandoraea pneumonica]|uniref:Uncharacterized protein n=1 Tax=Pandoraea pneumonica TaxID=2508299 RepID=A0A5E4UCM8_9BURK|nr:hypothetical protein [Pandoraea pneumonica]VVD97795.1 hypothetical protein PPN31114_01956 [Pandoraea pneumonica]